MGKEYILEKKLLLEYFLKVFLKNVVVDQQLSKVKK